MWKRWPLVVVLLALWGGIFAAGLPAPSGIDDLSYIDASFSLAATGRLEAPAMERYLSMWHTLGYCIQPPFYNYLLAAWLALFGISAASVLAFYALCYFLGSWAWWELLDFFGVGITARVLALIAFVPYILAACLRPEPVGLALLFAGLLILGSGRRGSLFLGFLTLGLASGVAVNLLPAAVTLSLAVLAVRYRGRIASNGPGELTEIAVPLILAIVVFLLLFSVLIRFHFHDFLVQFRDAVQARRGPPFYLAPREFFSYLLQYWRPVLVLPGFAGLMAVGLLSCGKAGRALPERVRYLIWSCAGMAVIGVFYRPGNLGGFTLFGWVAIFAFITAGPWRSGLKAAGLAGTLGFWLISQSLMLASLAETRSLAPVERARLQTELAEHPGRLVIDDFSARYLFDYRLPPGTLDVGYLRILPNYLPTAADKRPGETWVCSTYILNLYAPGLLASTPPQLRLFGHTFNLPRDPARIEIVP